MDQREAESIQPQTARRKLVRLWVQVCGALPLRKLASVLVWPTKMVEGVVAPLIDTGAVLADVRVEGQAGTCLADAEAYGQLAG